MSAAEPAAPARAYRRPVPWGWWLKKGHYFWYMVREFTALPIAFWLFWFLVEIGRLRNGAAGYHPLNRAYFLVFSVLVLPFALYHSVTFLQLFAVVTRIPIGQRVVPSGLVAAALFAAWLVSSAVIAFLLVWLAR